MLCIRIFLPTLALFLSDLGLKVEPSVFLCSSVSRAMPPRRTRSLSLICRSKSENCAQSKMAGNRVWDLRSSAMPGERGICYVVRYLFSSTSILEEGVYNVVDPFTFENGGFGSKGPSGSHLQLVLHGISGVVGPHAEMPVAWFSQC